MIKALVFSALVIFPFFTDACPLGEREDHLTFTRVMRNFGRYTRPAGMIAIRSTNKNEVITDAQLTEAAQKLSVVMSCAQAVIDNPTGDLLPMRIQLSSPEVQKAYAQNLVFAMSEFNFLLMDYQQLFFDILKVPAAQRNYQAIFDKTKELDENIEQAHKKLME